MEWRTCSSSSAEWCASRCRRARVCVPRVDLAQRSHERREIGGRRTEIVDRAVGVLAWQPLVDRPIEWIALGRTPPVHLHRNRERQVRPKLRQPLRLPCCLGGGPADARQSSGQLVAKPIDVVIGPVGHDRLDRQLGPPRKLSFEQAPHERGIGLDLVGVHLWRSHAPHHAEPIRSVRLIGGADGCVSGHWGSCSPREASHGTDAASAVGGIDGSGGKRR